MTLPSSGQIGVSDISVEIGQPTSYSTDLNFLNNLIVSGQRPSTPNMAGFYGKAYFANNTAGNCNNGNCSTASSSGNIQCTNCTITAINCSNCDTQSWLQSNCNCACTYNCTQNTNQTYACNCACACNCTACACACSDQRLKDNITPMYGALDRVSAMRGVEFSWNDRALLYGLPAFERTAGVIADEVERVLPEAIFNYKDMKSVNYGPINGLLIEAIKELRNEVSDLKSRKDNDI